VFNILFFRIIIDLTVCLGGAHIMRAALPDTCTEILDKYERSWQALKVKAQGQMSSKSNRFYGSP